MGVGAGTRVFLLASWFRSRLTGVSCGQELSTDVLIAPLGSSTAVASPSITLLSPQLT